LITACSYEFQLTVSPRRTDKEYHNQQRSTTPCADTKLTHYYVIKYFTVCVPHMSKN